ncbi:MAG: hypothetical protein ACOCZ8_05455, partial [Bacteroidota bacterium]
MSAPATDIPTDNALPKREKEPGLMERLGVRYYQRLSRQPDATALDSALPDDDTLRRKALLITFTGGLIAFIIGALT